MYGSVFPRENNSFPYCRERWKFMKQTFFENFSGGVDGVGLTFNPRSNILNATLLS
jgi:hypothetical protein